MLLLMLANRRVGGSLPGLPGGWSAWSVWTADLIPGLCLTPSDFQIAGRLGAALIKSRLQRRSLVRQTAGFRTASSERLKKQLMPGLREWTSNLSGTHGSTPWKVSRGSVPTIGRK